MKNQTFTVNQGLLDDDKYTFDHLMTKICIYEKRAKKPYQENNKSNKSTLKAIGA